MWITLACDNESKKIMICTIAADRTLALAEMTPEHKILDHKAFNLMTGSFKSHLHAWFAELGFTVVEATVMVGQFGKALREAVAEPVKRAHTSN